MQHVMLRVHGTAYVQVRHAQISVMLCNIGWTPCPAHFPQNLPQTQCVIIQGHVQLQSLCRPVPAWQ